MLVYFKELNNLSDSQLELQLISLRLDQASILLLKFRNRRNVVQKK